MTSPKGAERTTLELAEQAAFLRSVLEGSTEYSIVAKDLAGRILAWNEGARRVYGYQPEEIVGKSAFILHDPKDVKEGRAQQILDEAHRGGKWAGEIRRVRKDGTHFTAFVTITLRRDAAGKPAGYTMVSRDLTDTERLLAELRESQEYNRGLIESNIDALMTTDPLGLITDVNRQMCEMTGSEREELIGAPFKKYFTDPQRAEDGIRKVLAEDRVTNYELTMRSRSGKETVVSYNATTFRSSDKKLKGVFAAARDITDQKGLEEELRQTQNYTRGLIEASVDALLTVDPEMRVTDVNEQTVRTTGYSREELIGSPFPDYFTDPERAEAGVQKTLAEGVVTNYVLVLRARAGREVPVSFNASVFKDTAGRVRGIFAAARDIADQKRLEEELRQAQNYTRGLIESSVDPMITVTPDLVISDVNEQMIRLTETARERLIGSRFDRYFTEPERAATGVRKTLRENYVTNYELTLRAPSGREVLVSFNASVFKDTDGNVRGIFAVARDVTEQRGLEERLREQQNYSRSLIEASVDALMTVDPAGIITDVNEQTIKLLGYNRKQLIGSRFAEYFTDSARAEAGVKLTFAEGVVTDYELVIKPRAGAEMFVSFNASVFRDTAGTVVGILAAARDITQRRQIEQQLTEQQQYTRGLIESNIDALVTIDPIGLIMDVNRQMCEVTGRTREELIGSRFATYFTDATRAEDGVRRTLSESSVRNYVLTIRAKDGRETVVSYNATTFTGADGRLRGVFAAARDITDQKHLEEQLRQAHAYNRGLIESSVDAMLTVDADGAITDVNEQMVRLTGYPREQLIGSTFQDYFTEPQRASDGVRKTLAESFVTNYELTLRSRHRREILVSFNASVFKDSEGHVRGIFAVARDVTDQRRLEEQLREQQHYNRGLIESSVDALVTVDPDVVVTDVNEQMIRLTGYTREDLIGSSFKEYFTEPDRAAAGVRQTLSQGQVTNYELVLKSKSGKRTVVSFNAGTFKDTAGHVAGILAAARDITAQKRLEEQLRDQQNYNRSLIEASVDALMTVDPGGVITDVNEQTVKLAGYNRKQLIGSRFANYFTDASRADAGVKKTFTDAVVTNYELVIRAKTGRKIPVSFNAAVFRDAAGQVAGILAAAREITQQKQIEDELREQQTYTRGLIESNIDALVTIDPIGVIMDVNRQMCEVTGRTREALVGSRFADHFTDPRRAEDGVRQTLSDSQVRNYELTIHGAAGRPTIVSYNATTFTGADGRLRGVFAAARDITEQKRLEEQIAQRARQLAETTSFLNNVLESSTQYSIIAKDLDGNILTWNEGARRNYGWTAEDMVGEQNSNILHTSADLEAGRVRALLSTALETGKAEGVFERVRKDGQRFMASVSITLRQDTTGKPIGYLLISKDITEQNRLEEQLRKKNEELEEQYRRVQEANRLKSEFLANMSHELRTPLNAIIGFSEILHDGKAGDVTSTQKEFLGDILTSSQHLLQLINDVLDLAKVESGKMEFRPIAVDLPKIIGEVRDILRSLSGSKRIPIKVDIAPEVTGVVVDPAKLKQVLYNYLSNALKFTPEEGQVTVRVRAEDADQFLLEVEDTGIGIKKEDLARLFVEFQQLDASTAKKYAGTGLGLALTKRIVEAQGGTVGVRSVSGKGSTFSAVLPRVVAGAVERRHAPPVATPPGTPVVLVVEDDAADREQIGSTLAAAGYIAEFATTGADAIARCRERAYDVITLDMILPDGSGRDVLKAIRSDGPNQHTPVVIVTVVAEKGVVAGFQVHDIFTKPFEPKQLLASLQRAHVSPEQRPLILVVDDDPSARKLAERTLRTLGYRTLSVSDPDQGLDKARSEHPAAIVLDLMMPGIDGFEFLKRLRRTKHGRTVPVVIWTVKDLSAEERDRLLSPVQAIVIKTAGPQALLEQLQTFVAPDAGEPAGTEAGHGR